jgi:glutamate carboxypeptidase
VTANGVEAHAGLDPGKGASAIDELARVVLALHGLTDTAAGTTVNVGVVMGGTRGNVTAGQARGEVDIRVSSAAEAARIDDELAALRANDPRATLTVDGGWNRPAMERSERTAELFELTKGLAGQLGVELRECSVGGASDSNFVAALGLPVLDGFRSRRRRGARPARAHQCCGHAGAHCAGRRGVAHPRLNASCR